MCRPVVVTRLLVRDSIEQRVLAVQEAKHALFAGADGGAEDTAGGGCKHAGKALHHERCKAPPACQARLAPEPPAPPRPAPAELATTVEAPVGHEALDRRDVEGLLEGV
jgi:hypothetical protein